MKAARYLCLLSASIFCLLFLLPGAAYSQEMPHRTYFFVEVKDADGREIKDADVTLSDMNGKQLSALKTDEGGSAAATLDYAGGHHFNVQISKPGYLPYEEVFFTKFINGYRKDIAAGMQPSREDFDPRQQPQPTPIKIVLLKTPTTPAEREAFEAEERRRQLLRAAKRGDAASLRKLLQAGVEANAQDAAGIPAINWAAFAGDPETIKLLLAAGADVRNKNSPAHQALLIYVAEGVGRSYSFVRPQSNGSTETEKSPVQQHEEAVRMLLNAGAGVNVQSPFGGTALNLVIARSSYDFSVEIIKMLLAAKADVNAQDERGQTALIVAADRKSIDITGLLLEAGARASINFKDKLGRTALINASASSDVSVLGLVRVLLSAGARVNEVDGNGQTALMLAAGSSSVEIVRALLKAGAGASIDFRDKDGQTALIHAVINYWSTISTNAPAVIKELIAAGADVNLADTHGRTALMYAADSPQNSKLEMAKTLIAAGARVNEADEEGQTALMRAAKMGSEMLFEALLAAGAKASVNAKDKKGRAAIIYAMSGYGQAMTEIVEALLRAGASADETDEGGKTMLMLAVERGSMPTLKALLAAHASVNARDKGGRTALMYVEADLSDTALEFAKTLIEAGADVNARDVNGATPLLMAATQTPKGYTKKLQLLLRAGADIKARDNSGETVLMRLADYSFMEPGPEPARFLIAAGAGVNARDTRGQTALMHLRGNYASVVEIAKVLVEAGANVSAADNNGVTALMVAAKHDAVETVKVLLDAGARSTINAKDKTGWTALMYAAEGYYGNLAPAVIRALTVAGADVNAVNQNGQTALMLGAGSGNLDVVAALLEGGAASSINAKDNEGRTALAYVFRNSSGDSAARMTKALVAAGAK